MDFRLCWRNQNGNAQFRRNGREDSVRNFLPRCYGDEDEELCNIWIYARLDCYASTAALPNPFRMIKLGGYVSGTPEAPDGSKKSAHLTGWGVIDYAECLRVSEKHSPPDFGRHRGAIYKLPQISCENLGTPRAPDAPYLAARSPSAPKYFQNASPKEDHDSRVGLSVFTTVHVDFKLVN